jgi:hypothetical protein
VRGEHDSPRKEMKLSPRESRVRTLRRSCGVAAAAAAALHPRGTVALSGSMTSPHGLVVISPRGRVPLFCARECMLSSRRVVLFSMLGAVALSLSASRSRVALSPRRIVLLSQCQVLCSVFNSRGRRVRAGALPARCGGRLALPVWGSARGGNAA